MPKTGTLKALVKERIDQYVLIIDHLNLDAVKKKQLHTDVINFIKILETLADRHLLKNDITNVAVIILTAIVPILINIAPTKTDKPETGFTYLTAATILSVLLAILNGLRQSYKFRERWQNYRETAEQLILEAQSYFALSGKYVQFEDHNAGFKKFIDAVNTLRSKQINSYISQLMSVNDKEISQSITDEVNSRMTAINAAKEKINVLKRINDELNAYVKKEPGIAYFETDHDRKLVKFYVSDQSLTIPEKFKFQDQNLGEQVYRTSVALATATIHSKLVPSTGIQNKDMPNGGFGAAGCILKRSDNSMVFLTCYHVVKHSSQDWDFFASGNGHDDVVDTEGKVLGRIISAEKSEELDTAIVSIAPNIKYDELLPGQLEVAKPVYIDNENLSEYADVFIISRTRNFRQIRGKLAAVDKYITLNYGSTLNPEGKSLSGLMIVHYVSTEKFSLGGDSGSLVYASDGTPIGIVVGGDLDRASFVIPFTTINARYNFKFD